MTDTQIDLTAYQGQKLKFKHLRDGETVEQIEGRVELVNGPAMIISPVGSSMNKLIELRNIVEGSIEVVPDRPRELKAKRLDPLSANNARQHLLDRHGYELAVINEMTDDQAYREHVDIDHDRLGHYHAEKEVS